LSELTYFQAVLLGVIQGLTEFLPVSSTAHLAVAQRWLGHAPGSSLMLLFDMLVHMGTLVAMAVVFADTVKRFVLRLRKEVQPSWTGPKPGWRFGWLAVVACVPTAAIGLGFKAALEASFDDAMGVGWGMIITGLLLALTAWVRRGERGWRRFRWLHALLIGTAQGIAIVPGISRSGATICVASYCGLRRRWAADFSFLIAAPAIFGAALIKVWDTVELPAQEVAKLPWGPIMVGTLVSVGVGILGLRLFLNIVRRGRLHLFAGYCLLFGVLVLAAPGRVG